MTTYLNAPVVAYTTYVDMDGAERGSTHVACPYCERIHYHGVDGYYGPNCGLGHDYFVSGTEFARERYLKGDGRVMPNPFRRYRDLAKQVIKRPGWRKVPLDLMEAELKDFLIYHHGAPDAIRRKAIEEFEQWLDSYDFLMVAMRIGFVMRSYYYHERSGQIVYRGFPWEEPKQPDWRLTEAAIFEFKRRYK